MIAALLAVGCGDRHCAQARKQADEAWQEVIMFELRRGHSDHAELARQSRERALAGKGDWSPELQKSAMWEIAGPGPFTDMLAHATSKGLRVKQYCQ